MSRGPAVLAAPAMPQVDLLPTQVREARTLGAVKRRLLASLGVTALAVGTVAAVAELRAQDAAAQVAQADAETAALLAQQRPFAEVTTVRSELTTVRSARTYALGGEVLWSDYLGAVAAVTPEGVRIRTLDYVGATPLTPAPAAADPSVRSGIGTLSFTARATSVTDTADWADALDAVPGIADVRLRQAVRSETGAYEITGTMQVETTALAQRFATETEGDS